MWRGRSSSRGALEGRSVLRIMGKEGKEGLVVWLWCGGSFKIWEGKGGGMVLMAMATAMGCSLPHLPR